MTRPLAMALAASMVLAALPGCSGGGETAPNAGEGEGELGAVASGDTATQAAPRIVVDDGGVETTIHEVEKTPTPELLPVAEVARRVERGDAVICDVNVDEARAYYGVVPGARRLSRPSHFELDELPGNRDVPLIFYCSTPSCGASLQSGTRAILAGYTEVYAMNGGIAAWLESGRDTEPL